MAQANGAAIYNPRSSRTANARSLILGLPVFDLWSSMTSHQSPKSKVQSPKSKVQSPKTQNDVAAILLAAGRSRRMGAFKPLLPFGETTVVETCVNNLQATGVGELVVVVGHRADDVRNVLKERRVRFAFNSDPDSEMSVSIARGVEQIDSDTKAVIIALVD